MIQRATYLRDGRPRSVTFAGDLTDTAEFVELWERMARCTVLTVKPVRSVPDHGRIPADHARVPATLLDQGEPWEGW